MTPFKQKSFVPTSPPESRVCTSKNMFWIKKVETDSNSFVSQQNNVCQELANYYNYVQMCRGNDYNKQ